MRFESGGNRALLRDGSRAKRRSGQRQPLLHHREDVDLRFDAAGDERDADQAALERERLHASRHVVAANHVEHNVDAFAACGLPDHGDEILVTIVDAALGAQFLAGGALVG